MNTKQFLLLGGIVLVLLAVLGMFGFGPSVSDSALGETFYLDNGENIAHLVLGVVALAAYFLLKDESLRRYLVILVGIIALLATIIGFVYSSSAAPNVGVTNLELSDNILHLVVAAWAFYVAFMGSKSATPSV